MSKNIVLPKKDKDGFYYLSYSQYSKWKKSKRDYIRKYFFGEPEDNAGLQKYADFGHKVGEAFEHDNYSAFEEFEKEFLLTVPKYDEFETEIKLQMDGFYILGYIDTNTKEEDGYVKKVADYKTGSIESKKDDYAGSDYFQTDIYSAALEQKYGKLPDESYVFLIGRDGNAFKGEELTLSLEYCTIPREISRERIDQVVSDVQKVAEEISDYYKAFLEVNKL